MRSRPEKSEALTAATVRASMNTPSETNHQENSVSNSTLLPVFTGTLANCAVQLCDARTLHSFMQVRRDFTTWIKGRISKFGFVAGEDYLLTKSGEQVPHQGGTRTVERIDYHLTLDMAKELAMVENNAQGRAARRYFIECERRALAATSPASSAIDYDRISPAQAQDLKEIVATIVREGVQGFGETWTRLQKKFKVNSYLQLPATQHLEARRYLIAKLPKGYAGDVVSEAAKPSALPRLQLRHLPPPTGTYRFDPANPYPANGRTIEVAKSIVSDIRIWSDSLPGAARQDLYEATEVLNDLLVSGWTEVDEALGQMHTAIHMLNRWQGRGGRAGNTR